MAESGQRAGQQGRSSGWAPYWAPMVSFLLVVELSGRVPDQFAPIFLVLRVAAPLGFFAYFLRRGAYPELAGARWGAWALADVAVGLLGAALWIAPFLLWDALRPDEPGFDIELLGPRRRVVHPTLRFIGYAGVTPFVEELFVRSWLLRYVDVASAALVPLGSDRALHRGAASSSSRSTSCSATRRGSGV